MQTQRTLLFFIPFMFFLFLFIGCTATAYVAEEPEANATIIVPAWAPPYEDIHHVRYYYMPDIEVFYDVWNQEFVYLQDGNWTFVSSIPQTYAGFDLYNSFVVVLDAHVYEPWMHFHYYVSHYPRYYYYSYYNITDTHELRGFNENTAGEIRLKPAERTRLDEASKSRPDRERVQASAQEQKTQIATRPQQRMKYYGQDIGKPVKVEKQMMKPKEHSEKPDNHQTKSTPPEKR